MARPRPDPVRYLQRRRKRRRVAAAGLLVVGAVLFVVDRSGLLLHAGSDWARYHGQTHRVAGVIDGDTLDLAVRDGRRSTTRVRLWGVDTPELGRDGRPAERGAEAARRRAEALALDQPVKLTLQRHRVRDRFGRLLAFVELPDGRSLNATLIAEGLSPADTRWSHDRLGTHATLQTEARRRGAGLWSDREPG
ncbi:MAG: thermonuclease family protein [Planctomycetota bacterium]